MPAAAVADKGWAEPSGIRLGLSLRRPTRRHHGVSIVHAWNGSIDLVLDVASPAVAVAFLRLTLTVSSKSDLLMFAFRPGFARRRPARNQTPCPVCSSKLWRCLRHSQRRSSSLVVVRPAGVHNDAASGGRAGAATVRGCVLRWPSPPRVHRETNFRYHTRGQAFGIGSSVMASPLLEIKPKPNWAQHSAHRTRSGQSLISRATVDLEIGAMTCWRPPRPGFGRRTSASCA